MYTMKYIQSFCIHIWIPNVVMCLWNIGDVPKLIFLSTSTKANVLIKREKPFNFFLSDSRKFIVLQQIDSGFKLGILWKPIDLSDARSVEIYWDANDIGLNLVKFSFYILLRKQMQQNREKGKFLVKSEELENCTSLWAKLTDVGFRLASTLKKQVMMDIGFKIMKNYSLAGKFHNQQW